MKRPLLRAVPSGAVLHRERRPVRGAKGFIEHVSEVEWVEPVAVHKKHGWTSATRDAEELARLREQLGTATKHNKDLRDALEATIDRFTRSGDASGAFIQRLHDALVAAEADGGAPESLLVAPLPAPLEGELAADYLATLREFEDRDGVHHWVTGPGR